MLTTTLDTTIQPLGRHIANKNVMGYLQRCFTMQLNAVNKEHTYKSGNSCSICRGPFPFELTNFVMSDRMLML